MKKLIFILLLFSCKGYEVVDVIYDNGSYIHCFCNMKQGEDFKQTTIVKDSLTWLIGTKMSLEQIREASKKE